jgi:hypothetical protein
VANREIRRWLSLRGLIGGLGLFASEALAVIALLGTALLVSLVVLALL